LFAGKWLELEIMMLSEISQTKKDKISYVLSHIWNLGFKQKRKKKREREREKGRKEGTVI
jgi:hypothetical protein